MAERPSTRMANERDRTTCSRRFSASGRWTRRSGSSGISARSRSWRRWRIAGRRRGCSTRGCRTYEVAARTGASTTTVTRVAQWLRHGEDGYRLALDRRERSSRPDRLRIAIPAKGRLREPAVALLADAGLGPEQPGERALAFPCRNAPVDVLLVRAADMPEYVQDGVVDCGITGADLVREQRRGRRASCCGSASAPARSRRRCPPSRMPSRSRISRARRVATVVPASRAASSWRARDRGRARRRHGLGRGRAAPRARRRDRRPRLEREHAAHERAPLGRRRSSRRRRCSIAARSRTTRARASSRPVLRSVVDARETRYLMLNAPESALEEICEIVPARARRASLPLAEPGMVAVHALVPAADVWRLLPQLEAAGGVVDPARARRADAPGMSDVAAIVEDVRAAATRPCASGRCGSTASSPHGRAAPERASRPRRCSCSPTRVRRWHEAQRPADVRSRSSPESSSSGAGSRSARVGIYVPRGLVSTLVMCAVPAQVAGVERIVVVDAARRRAARRRGRRGCSASTRSGRSAGRRRSRRSRTARRRSRAWTRSSGPAART